MTARATKISLVLAVALFYTLVVFNNVTDYNTNYQFVRHVLMMDSTAPGNHGMSRAINSPAWHTAAYISIIGWESFVMVLCWAASWRMMRQYSSSSTAFEHAKRVAIAALTLGLLMWLIAFLAVGGEWFLMWQSKTWNGQDEAFRMFTVTGIVLLLIVQPENETHPLILSEKRPRRPSPEGKPQ